MCLAVVAVAVTHAVTYARCMVHVRSRCMVIAGTMVAVVTACVNVNTHAGMEYVAGAQGYQPQSRCADDEDFVHCCLYVVVNNRNV